MSRCLFRTLPERDKKAVSTIAAWARAEQGLFFRLLFRRLLFSLLSFFTEYCQLKTLCVFRVLRS